MGCGSRLRILLIEPRYGFKDAQAWLPLGKASLAAFLRSHGFSVSIIDNALENLSDSELSEAIKTYSPDIIGTGGMTIQWRDSLRIARISRESTCGKALIVGGGVHLTVAPEEGLRDFDIVVVGEGEHTLLELCQAYEQGLSLDEIPGLVFMGQDDRIRRTGLRPYELCLDSFPFPALDILPVRRYHDFLITGERAISVMTGRGCPYNCTFCASPLLYQRKARTHSVKPVLDWMETLASTYGCTNFRIMDDTFASSRSRVVEFCEEVQNRGLHWNMTCLTHVSTADPEMFAAMQAAGFSIVALGIESGNDQVLQKINKRITSEQAARAVAMAKSAGLAVEALFMIGNIGETRETILDTLAFARKHNPPFENGQRVGFNWFQFATPFPGSRFHEEAPASGTILSTDYEDYTHQVPVFIPVGLDERTMIDLREQGLRECSGSSHSVESRFGRSKGSKIDAIVFGAGQYGRIALDRLSETFRILAFVDNASGKWGTQVQGLTVSSPDTLLKEFAGISVIIANFLNHRTLAMQLLGMGIDKFMVFLEDSEGVYRLYASEAELFHAKVLEDCRLLLPAQKPVEFNWEPRSYQAEARRVFFITVFDFAGECGGPSGVIARLRSQNTLMNDIPNAIYVFGQCVMAPAGARAQPKGLIPRQGMVSEELARLVLEREGYSLESHFSQTLINRVIWLEQAKARILQIHDQLGFCTDDFYVFHDVESAFLFSLLFEFRNTMVVYHNQGALYYEYQAFGGEPDLGMERILYAMQRTVFSACQQTAFPARGAYEALIATEPRLESAIGESLTLHNGCNVLDAPRPSSRAQSVFDAVKDAEAILITVAALNQAKAIERIPPFLRDARSKGMGRLKWILIGNGALEREVEEAIAQAEIAENVVWVRERITNEDIQFLMSKSDYYLILQRFAIFDFATIEAMGHGCIPVLSNVFGNKECIVEDNGLLLDDVTDACPLIHLHHRPDRHGISQHNRELHARLFSAQAFLERYRGAIARLLQA